MLDWLSSLSLQSWGILWAGVVGTAVIAVLLFGRETVRGWVEAIYKSRRP